LHALFLSLSLSFNSSLAFARTRYFSWSLSTCNLLHCVLYRPNFETNPSFSHIHAKSWLPGVGKSVNVHLFIFVYLCFPIDIA